MNRFKEVAGDYSYNRKFDGRIRVFSPGRIEADQMPPFMNGYLIVDDEEISVWTLEENRPSFLKSIRLNYVNPNFIVPDGNLFAIRFASSPSSLAKLNSKIPADYEELHLMGDHAVVKEFCNCLMSHVDLRPSAEKSTFASPVTRSSTRKNVGSALPIYGEKTPGKMNSRTTGTVILERKFITRGAVKRKVTEGQVNRAAFKASAPKFKNVDGSILDTIMAQMSERPKKAVPTSDELILAENYPDIIALINRTLVIFMKKQCDFTEENFFGFLAKECNLETEKIQEIQATETATHSIAFVIMDRVDSLNELMFYYCPKFSHSTCRFLKAFDVLLAGVNGLDEVDRPHFEVKTAPLAFDVIQRFYAKKYTTMTSTWK